MPVRCHIAIAMVAGLLLAGAASAGDGLVVTDAWARASPPGVDKSAVYFRVQLAEDGASDRLIGVVAPGSGHASLHETVNENGQSRMVSRDAVMVSGGGAVAFEPGGYHVMVTGLAQPLEAGEALRLILRFEHRGERVLDVPVRPLGASGPAR